MKRAKDILKSDIVRSLLCWLGAQYIRFVYHTSSWEIQGRDSADQLWAENKPFILAFWHGRLLMLPYCWDRKKSIHMLISAHRDGVIISKIVQRFGISTIVGSSSKGGGTALRAIIKRLKGGESIGITPDGPRGPRMHATDGVVAIAKLSGCPILPVTFAANRGTNLNNWDRFFVAKPFSRGVILWGEAITVEKGSSDETVEQKRQEVENELIRISLAADEMMGRDPITPAHLDAEEC